MRDCDFCKGYWPHILLTRNPDNDATICDVCVRKAFLAQCAFVNGELEYRSWLPISFAARETGK